MTNTQRIRYREATPADRPALAQFLWSVRADFPAVDGDVIDEILSLLFHRGGVIVGEMPASASGTGGVVGLFGYFLGEPSRRYANRDVALVYIAALAPDHRRTGAFRRGVDVLTQVLHRLGVREVRCHAAEGDPYTNAIYARLGRVIGQERNRRGILCNLYANSMENLLEMAEGKRRLASTAGGRRLAA